MITSFTNKHLGFPDICRCKQEQPQQRQCWFSAPLQRWFYI